MLKKALSFVFFCLILIIGWSYFWGQNAKRTQLWPEIEPFQKDYLQVSELHKIYYEICGNPTGNPVFVLHGGPGGSCTPYYRRFFDPESFLIVLHDQRGAGKSKPQFEIKENTTQNLVADIEKLRLHLKLDKIILFGGSWGSTLALAYAETYPDNVNGMVLRGIFTATKREIAHFYSGGTENFFPETYEQLKKIYGEDPTPKIIFESLQEGDRSNRMKYAEAWTGYEIKLSELSISDNQVSNLINTPGLKDDVLSIALLENFYMTNGCFLEEGQLLRNTSKIEHIPTVLVNGRYDMICPPVNAYRLHKLLPKSRLEIVERAGHSMGEVYIQRALIQAVQQFE